jgi:antitoxin component of MazEF toxin-antitoxin module
MNRTVILSRDHTISLPEELVGKLHFAANDEIIARVVEDKLILSKKESDYTGRLRGLHKEVWENVGTEKFLKKERQSWDGHAGN